jgi:hypothetical protein
LIRELNIINIIPFTSTLVFLALFSLPLGAASDPLQTVTETITPSAVNWEQLGDRLKGLGIGKSATTDIGGQFRMRFHDENNIRNTAGVPNALGLTAADDSFLLYRTRLWFDTQVNENLSVYAELLDANSTLEQRSPRPIDENRLDLHQLYIDTTIQENWQARVGRQAFTLGAQRLVSSLDWANTRRVFDGVSVKRNGERFGVNLFWFQPITIDVSNSDHTNHAVNLYGAYVNAAVNEDRHLDLYWIALDNSGSGTKYDTLGGKLTGRGNNWDYEFEGGYQFGDNSDGSDHQAGFTSIGLGKDLTHKIGGSLWIYHDWASGDDTVGNGFHHYIPLAHKYLGFMDLYGRRNLHDFNMRRPKNLNERITGMVWYHYSALTNGNDVPYNITMKPFANLASGSAGSREVDHEIDLTTTIQYNARTKLLFGYSHFFAGQFYSTTPGIPTAGSPDSFFAQMTLDF